MGRVANSFTLSSFETSVPIKKKWIADSIRHSTVRFGSTGNVSFS